MSTHATIEIEMYEASHAVCQRKIAAALLHCQRVTFQDQIVWYHCAGSELLHLLQGPLCGSCRLSLLDRSSITPHERFNGHFPRWLKQGLLTMHDCFLNTK